MILMKIIFPVGQVPQADWGCAYDGGPYNFPYRRIQIFGWRNAPEGCPGRQYWCAAGVRPDLITR